MANNASIMHLLYSTGFRLANRLASATRSFEVDNHPRPGVCVRASRSSLTDTWFTRARGIGNSRMGCRGPHVTPFLWGGMIEVLSGLHEACLHWTAVSKPCEGRPCSSTDCQEPR